MKERIREIWHDLYYKYSPQEGVALAMTCKEAVEQMNLSDTGKLAWLSWLRLKLHLSLCRACAYYDRAGKALGKAVRELAQNSKATFDLEKLNQDLLEKHARNKE